MRRCSMGSSSRGAAGAFLLAVIIAGAAASCLAHYPAGRADRARLLNGEWTAEWRAAYERALPVRKGAAAVWTLLSYSLFHEAGPEVLVGSEGWLYSTEEFDPPEDLSVPLDDAVERISSVRDALAAKGIDLVIALVPTKASVEDSHLGRYRIPATLAARYDDARSALLGRGIAAPDIRRSLRDAASTADTYFRTDTHWTPLGARCAAAAVADVAGPILERHHSTRTSFTTEYGPRRQYVGDLLQFVPLGPWRGKGPAPDEVKGIVAAAGARPAAAEELFATPDIPVALVGTSYSANPTSGFRYALKDALDADVLAVAQEGRGPFAPMDGYLSSSAIDDPRPDVVVWEIPERYLIPGP